MTNTTTEQPERDPDEEEEVAPGTPQFEEMKRAVLEAAKARLRGAVKDGLERAAERNAERNEISQTLADKAGPVLGTFNTMLGMPIEDQVFAQFTCMTQSAMDCMVRAAALEDETPPANGRGAYRAATPQTTRRSQRHQELDFQARLATSSAQMLDALGRYRNQGHHHISYTHRPDEAVTVTPHAAPSSKQKKKKKAQTKTIDERTEGILEGCFWGMSEGLDRAYSSPPEEE